MLERYNLGCLFLIKAYTKIINIVTLMTCITCFNIQSEGVHISALEHCRKIKFSIRVYVYRTLMYTMLCVNNVMLE